MLSSIRKIALIVILCAIGVFVSACGRHKVNTKEEEVLQEAKVGSTDIQEAQPFYGIWCQASKDLTDAQSYAEFMKAKGFDAHVFVTTDWSNLNTEMWYVVTAGMYGTEKEADSALLNIQTVCKDAYVKYSGNYQGDSIADPIAPDAQVVNHNPPFYGIWCYASKDESEMQEAAAQLTRDGIYGMVFVTTDWSNLNTEKWYVVTAGVYISLDSAKYALKHIQEIIPDAYIKYSGNYQGETPYEATQINNLTDGSYNICITDLTDDGMIIYRNFSMGACADMGAVGNLQKVPYDSSINITLIDSETDYSPDAPHKSVSTTYFQDILDAKADEKGYYGYACVITIENGKVIMIDELYLP